MKNSSPLYTMPWTRPALSRPFYHLFNCLRYYGLSYGCTHAIRPAGDTHYLLICRLASINVIETNRMITVREKIVTKKRDVEENRSSMKRQKIKLK